MVSPLGSQENEAYSFQGHNLETLLHKVPKGSSKKKEKKNLQVIFEDLVTMKTALGPECQPQVGVTPSTVSLPTASLPLVAFDTVDLPDSTENFLLAPMTPHSADLPPTSIATFFLNFFSSRPFLNVGTSRSFLFFIGEFFSSPTVLNVSIYREVLTSHLSYRRGSTCS